MADTPCFHINKLDPRTWSLAKLFDYYKRNLRRFTHLVRTGQLDKIFRPGRFTQYPVNNAEKLLNFGKVHFGGFVNGTKEGYAVGDILVVMNNFNYEF